MKRAGGIALAVALPGGVLAVGGVMFAAMYRAARTGIGDLDRWAIRGNAVLALLMAWRLEASPRVARAFVGGILANEAAYTPGDRRYGDAQFPRGRAGYYPLGDVSARLGPAVGPGQVLSGLHLRRLGYTGDPLELARVGNELRALYYAATVFREAYAAAGGATPDARLREAVRRYNGSGPAAEAYASRAFDRIASLGGLPA